MRNVKKLLRIFLSMLFVLSMVLAVPTTTKAEEYTYRIRIVLGGTGDEGASFNKNLGLTIPDNCKVSFFDDGNGLEISNIKYNQRVTIDPFQMISLEPQTRTDDDGNTFTYQKYYVKGLRLSGTNTVLAASSFEVSYDETFVVAYGVGEVVPYKVNYINKETNDNTFEDFTNGGTKTVESVTCFAPVGTEVYVPYAKIEGYSPNAYNYHTKKLKAPEVDENGNEKPFEFTFYYKKGGSTTVIENTVEVIETATVQGAPEYTYQTVTRPTTITNTTTNRPANGGNGGAGNADANAADGDNANGDNGNGNGEGDGTTIADEETPLDIIDIDDEETAKHGETRKDKLIRKMIICILIAVIAVVSILVALLVAYKKRKGVVAKVEEKKDTKE